MTRTVVGVLRGGTGGEYELSLKTGTAIMLALPEERYDVRDIYVDRGGLWHLRGIPVTPARILSQIDVVFNAIHGGVGEDGTISRILEMSNMPFVGSHTLPSALSFHKGRARDALIDAGIKMPRGVEFMFTEGRSTADMAREVFAQFGPPYIVKPLQEGSGIGIMIADTVAELPEVLGEILDAFKGAIVEEFIFGKQAHVSTLRDYRGKEMYTFPPIETTVPSGKRWIDTELYVAAKYHQCPAAFTHEQKQILNEVAARAHETLAIGPYSHTSFIVGKKDIYLLELDTTPMLHTGSPLSGAIDAVGSNTCEVCEHLISMALHHE